MKITPLVALDLTVVFSRALQVGSATWVGVGYMFFLMPTTAAVVAVVKKNRREVIRFSDLRVRLMNELLTGIRIVKLYARERPFGRQVANLCDQELKALTKLAYVSALGFSFLVISAPIIQPILVFATFVKIEDQPLSASTAFTTVALFNIMRFPFVFMPIALVQYVQSLIALKRVVRYLCLPELTEYVQPRQPTAIVRGFQSRLSHGTSR
jgi:ABC-type bacteriocin/lantibiotic exporter with double-glycine peptidase domain